MKHVIRRLMRSPMFSAITLITLAVGIGATTAVFSVVNGVLLKPLPYPEPERLVAIWQTAPGLNITELNASPATYFIYREQSKVFEDVGLWRDEAVSITGIAQPERVNSLVVTDGMLPILGIQPQFGRWFSRKDDSPGSPETVMLSHGYWQRRFGGDRSVIGRRLLIDGKAREVIGVMPPTFRFLETDAEVILPFQLNRSKVFVGNFSYQAAARLKPGVTLEQANADVARMLPMLSTTFPPPPGFNVQMLQEARLGPSVRPLKHDAVGDIGKVLWVLMGAITIVLFIACANVANLLLVRAEGRQHELAVRAALGAGWGQIARELLLESISLALAGGALGVALAYAGLRILVSSAPAGLPRLEEIGIDLPVLVFAFLVSLAAGVLFGLLPVWKYAGPQLGTGLREGNRNASHGKERHRARSTLVVVQVSLALVLLISSGLMIRTLNALQDVKPGFTHGEQLLTMRVSIPEAQVPDPERVARIQQEMLRKMSEVPSVVSVAMANSITMDGNTSNDPVFARDKAYAENQIPPIRRYKTISPGFFDVMGRAFVAGRDFTWTDVHNRSNVVLVSENLARELWGSPAAAVGKQVREAPKSPWREVIGVVADERDNGVNQKAPAIVYWPVLVNDLWGEKVAVRRSMAFVVRSSRTGTADFLNQLQQAIWSVNPDVPVARVRTVEAIYKRSLARTSFTLSMISIAAGMSMLLGLVGIYGVISYSVTQRTREIGIRMALGAQHPQLRAMFVRHGLLLAAIGVGIGLAAAATSSRLLSVLLFEVSPLDPITYAIVSMGLLIAAMLASYFPARRATGVDPINALRTE